MPRVKQDKELIGENIFEYNEQEKRFGTPKIIAEYRAKKLKCNTILEVGCGTGFQTAAFAKTCKKVIGIDIDKEKIKKAKKNMQKLGITNAEFITGDILDENIQAKIPKTDIIFLDPERPPQEKKRNINNIKPNINKFLKWAQTKTKKICIEIPPHLQDLPNKAMKEYISINHKINRAHLLFGTKEGARAVMLPENKTIEGKQKKREIKKINWAEMKYISELDPSIVYAKLEWKILPKTRIYNKNKAYCLSKHYLRTPFATNYRILKILETENKVQKYARTLQTERIIQHNMQTKLKHEKGTGQIHIFHLQNKYIIALTCKQAQQKTKPSNSFSNA
ncbi:hypothetical protein B6U93_04000 [Candidatus Woesearchaeota archaeon ex4484_78]|nr:MAG: hypothetical protein B6U93_04000 [Candidatus Woesearchaeota archaeon ex4484_78]